MRLWGQCGADIAAWRQQLESASQSQDEDIWPAMEHVPGFDPNGVSCAAPIRQTLRYLSGCATGGPLSWLQQNREELERIAGSPLTMTGLTACAFVQLGFEPSQGEMLFLLLRLPGAAAHALEQEGYGWRRYPFFSGLLQLAPEADPAVHDDRAG